MTESIVSVIPARGGSKGIPRKNIRILDGDPLLSHSIRTSLASGLIDKTVVTTDDNEILKIARSYGADDVIERPTQLATDEVPLAPVIEHAAGELEESFDYVLCFQPTVPLISLKSLNAGIRTGLNGNADSVVFLRDTTHNYWREHDGEYVPLTEDRKNRQQMDNIYGEIGIFLSRMDVVRGGQRIGESPTFHTVNTAEGIDIDDYTDWVLAEGWLDRQTLLYRVTGNNETGMGHIYRGISIATHSTEHDVTFAVSEEDTLAIDLLERNNFEYELLSTDEAVVEYVDSQQHDIIVNDILSTAPEYMQTLKQYDTRVVNIEDVSDGSSHADAVINALYEFSDPPKNHYYGYRYFCLRNEFRYSAPVSDLSEVERIMVSFGGVDQNDLTSQTLRALNQIGESFVVDVILGPGYSHTESLNDAISDLSSRLEINVYRDVAFMSNYMEQSDLLITSNGRTVYESTALNLPTISIAQNQREQQHPFVHVTQGILNLGLADYISEKDIANAVGEYVTDQAKREQMRSALAGRNIQDGVKRVKSILFEDN